MVVGHNDDWFTSMKQFQTLQKNESIALIRLDVYLRWFIDYLDIVVQVKDSFV